MGTMYERLFPDAVLILLCSENRIGLVLVEPEPLAPRVSLGLVLPEDVVAALVEHTPADELIDVFAGLEGGVELDEGLGPEQSAVQLRVDRRRDLKIGRASCRERV